MFLSGFDLLVVIWIADDTRVGNLGTRRESSLYILVAIVERYMTAPRAQRGRWQVNMSRYVGLCLGRWCSWTCRGVGLGVLPTFSVKKPTCSGGHGEHVCRGLDCG